MKRDYPEHPIIGVGAVIIQADRVLLVRRATEPLRGEWSVPGGMLELGENTARRRAPRSWKKRPAWPSNPARYSTSSTAFLRTH